MIRYRFLGLLGSLSLVGACVHAESTHAEQYFGGNPLPDTECPEYYAVFMQHHPGTSAQTYFGGLHSGIDIAGDTNDKVYTATHMGTTARVAFVGEYPDKKILIASGMCSEPEALMLGHTDPIANIEPGYECYGPTWVGMLNEKQHLHAELYKGFTQTELWTNQMCEHIRNDVNDPITNPEMKRYLVNPARYAFEDAGFLADNCGDDCWPYVDTDDIVYYQTDEGYKFHFPANDHNNSNYDCGALCNLGVYEITLHVDEGTVAEDSLCFDKFVNRDGEYPPTQDDFYFYPSCPPSGCNQSDELEYYLDWITDDPSGSHSVRIYVRDLAGHELQLSTTITETVLPQIALDCEVVGSAVRLSWRIPSAARLDSLYLTRSFGATTTGRRVNSRPIPTTDDGGQPLHQFEYVDHVAADWDTLWYTLTAHLDDREECVVGRTWITNPRRGELVLRVWPNPFNPIVHIEFYNPDERYIELCVYSVRGRRARQLAAASLPRGTMRTSWDGRLDNGQLAPPGVYLLSIRSGHMTAVEKLILVK